uniref:Ig-like domain-containing protein n=1 Tax=Trichogramma kaykai TaxID=54128 RepID=A0ABD2W9S6_9HYME
MKSLVSVDQTIKSAWLANTCDINVNVKIPREAEINKSVNLDCTWWLSSNNSSLYSVKWYKDEYEFYSYMPENDPDSRIKTHPVNGVNVDPKSSRMGSIRLLYLTLNSTGQYKCEVSTGAPFFATNYVKDNLTVIALPKQGPQITGLTQQYALGENVTANCTAWPSVPKAQLKWTINNKTVPYDYVVQHPTHQPIESQGTPNSIGLRFTIDNRYLKTASYLGALRIRCVALVGSRRFETEQPVMLAHANNQRFSAGDLRSRAPSAAYSLALLLLGTILTAT